MNHNLKSGQVIGFASQFYTLWSFEERIEYRMVESTGQYVPYRLLVDYHYIKNISHSLETAKQLHPGLQIDENLRGMTRSFQYAKKEEDLSPQLIKFGKYSGKTIYEIAKQDFGYAMWLFDNCYNWKTRYLIGLIPEVWAKVDEDRQQEKKNREKWGVVEGVVEVTFFNNPNRTLRNLLSNNEEYGFDKDCVLEGKYDYYVIGAKINDDVNNTLYVLIPEVKSVSGLYPYNMAIINGKAQKTKGKTMRIKVKNLLYKQYKFNCDQYAELVEDK